MSADGGEMPGHATRRQVIAGFLVPRGVRAGMNAGNGRRPIVCTRNRTNPISGCAKNGDAPKSASVHRRPQVDGPRNRVDRRSPTPRRRDEWWFEAVDSGFSPTLDCRRAWS